MTGPGAGAVAVDAGAASMQGIAARTLQCTGSDACKQFALGEGHERDLRADEAGVTGEQE